MPKVSVILTTYNRAYILSKAIESVLAQTFKDFELIIVDDGSTDDTEKVILSFVDNRIRYIKHDINSGLAVSRNTGIKAATGKFVAYQDSDDEWMPDKLKIQVPVLERAPAKVGVVYSRLEKVLKDKTKIFLPHDNMSQTEGDLHRLLLEFNFITMQVVLMRMECFRKVGLFDKNLNWLEDWDFWIRISKYYEFLYVPYTAVRAAILSDSLTSNKAKRLDARCRTFEKHRSEFKKYFPIYTRTLYNIGHAYAILGDVSVARKYLSEAFRLRFWKLKYMLAYFLSFFGGNAYNSVTKLYSRFT